MTLAQWIIDHTNTESYRAGTLIGWKHPNVDTKLIELVGGKNELLKQAVFLEKNTNAARCGQLKFKWRDMKFDIEKIDYDIAILPELCAMEKKKDPRLHQLELIAAVQKFREEVQMFEWACHYYDEILDRLLAGKNVKEAEDTDRFICFNAIAKQKEPVWERVFSVRIFGDSKKFQKCYRQKMISALKDYSPYYEDDMEEYDFEEEVLRGQEILKMHGILSYAQTLEWKGAVQYTIDGGEMIDTSHQKYGIVLNTQTLEHALPIALPDCKKIMTIENKANYESMVYCKDTLYIFCHGFFTPKERVFLKKLYNIVPDDCEFYHWGDMDFGGINIFLFIRKHIFPKLKPYRMGVDDFKAALKRGAAVPLKSSAREKLLKKEAGPLSELKNIILETGQTIEQEMLL